MSPKPPVKSEMRVHAVALWWGLLTVVRYNFSSTDHY